MESKQIVEWWPPPGFEPQGQYLAGSSPEDIRKTFVQIARSGVGLSPASGIYLGLCYPGDTVKHQRTMAASQEMCALTVAGWMRCAGCRHHLLAPPYWGRNDAFTRIEVIARSYKPSEDIPVENRPKPCWGGHDSDFDEGDIVIIGTDVPYDSPQRSKIIQQWGTPGHATLVEKIGPKDGTMVTIDGGRGPVKRTNRSFHRDAQGRLWVESAGAPMRRVWGVVRVGLLEFDPEAEWYLPKGPGYPGL